MSSVLEILKNGQFALNPDTNRDAQIPKAFVDFFPAGERPRPGDDLRGIIKVLVEEAIHRGGVDGRVMAFGLTDTRCPIVPMKETHLGELREAVELNLPAVVAEFIEFATPMMKDGMDSDAVSTVVAVYIAKLRSDKEDAQRAVEQQELEQVQNLLAGCHITIAAPSGGNAGIVHHVVIIEKDGKRLPVGDMQRVGEVAERLCDPTTSQRYPSEEIVGRGRREAPKLVDVNFDVYTYRGTASQFSYLSQNGEGGVDLKTLLARVPNGQITYNMEDVNGALLGYDSTEVAGTTGNFGWPQSPRRTPLPQPQPRASWSQRFAETRVGQIVTGVASRLG